MKALLAQDEIGYQRLSSERRSALSSALLCRVFFQTQTLVEKTPVLKSPFARMA
jgi:hypothetical protein